MYPILEAKKLADKIYLMVVKAPRISANCKPGEFVIVKMDEKGERIPLTICDYDREKETITIVFQTVGASTERMSALQTGDSFRDVVGPLGNPSDFVKEDIEELVSHVQSFEYESTISEMVRSDAYDLLKSICLEEDREMIPAGKMVKGTWDRC